MTMAVCEATRFCCFATKFLLFSPEIAGDLVARGGNFGGSTLAAVFRGMKFWAVLVILEVWMREPESARYVDRVLC